MKRTTVFTLSLAASLMALSVACDHGPRSVCGNGVAEGPEECDGSDLSGVDCRDIIPGNYGVLLCHADCTFDTSGCGSHGGCSNGIIEFGEICDCGADPDYLPEGCPDVNGGANANCDTSCSRIDVCGDGLRSGDEECDCGTDPELLPVDCLAVNGADDARCAADCHARHLECYAAPWESCTTGDPSACCPDDQGSHLDCAEHRGMTQCLRNCEFQNDCYWSTQCEPASGGYCDWVGCGPGMEFPALDGPCTVAGAQGWCVAMVSRPDPSWPLVGRCVENGTLGHGDPCVPDDYPFPQLDRTELSCNLGLCLAGTSPTEGICRQHCHPEAAYEAAIYGQGVDPLPCPVGSNCFTDAHLFMGTGARTSVFGWCAPTQPSAEPHARTTCSLVTGQVLADPGSHCADVVPGTICQVVEHNVDEPRYGSLIGVCAVPTTLPNVVVWETCAAAGQVCPESTLCVAEDFFADTPTGASRCVPLCDAQYHTGATDCTALGAGDPTAVCRSLSEHYAPGDLSPTRLGLCALP